MLRTFFTRLFTKLNRRYRVSFVDDEKLSMSRQYTLKPVTVLILSSIIFLGVVSGTAAFVIFTPSIRVHIPDCINPELQNEVESMRAALDTMERMISVRDSILASYERVFEESEDAELPVNPVSMINGPVIGGAIPENNNVIEEAAAEKVKPIEEPKEERIPAVKIANRFSDKPLIQLFPPINGEIRRGFIESEAHYGVDYVADKDEMVKASTAGFVIFAEYSNSTGYVIGIAGKDNVITFYKHNSRLLKRIGDYVFAGESIAVIGNSGENSTGPHLHFELWHKGQPLNPIDYISVN